MLKYYTVELVSYRKTNHGEPRAQEMVTRLHPCGGLFSYLMRTFCSTRVVTVGSRLSSTMKKLIGHLSLQQEKGCNQPHGYPFIHPREDGNPCPCHQVESNSRTKTSPLSMSLR